MFYYAEINSEYLVTNVHSLETSSTNENYVSITEDQYTNGDLVGQYYNSLLDIFEVINMMDYMGNSNWMLLWSDYDPGDGANDTDFCTTFIPKYTPSGGTWGGKAFYCDIPMYVGSDATDLSTEKRCIKPIYVHDDCLKGSYQNTSGGRNDVVLRAVYEV